MPGEELSSVNPNFYGSSSTTNLAGTSSTQSNTWPNKKDDYDLQDPIGVGATATVYKVLILINYLIN